MIFDAVHQQCAQGGRDGRLIEGVAQGQQATRQGHASLPHGHLLANFEFFAQIGQFIADHGHDFATAQVIALVMVGLFSFLGDHRHGFHLNLGFRFCAAWHFFAPILIHGLAQQLGKWPWLERRRSAHDGRGLICLQCQLGWDGLNVNGHDQFGLPPDLTAGDDQHVIAVQGDRFFIGRLDVAGQDALEFHDYSRFFRFQSKSFGLG